MDIGSATHERTLHTAALGGDGPAWAELYHASYDTVFRYALWRCGGGVPTLPKTWCKKRGFSPLASSVRLTRLADGSSF